MNLAIYTSFLHTIPSAFCSVFFQPIKTQLILRNHWTSFIFMRPKHRSPDIFNQSQLICPITKSQISTNICLFNQWLRSLERDLDVKFAEGTRNTPRVWLFIFVVERLNFLLLFGFTQFSRVWELEELWCKLNKPSSIDGRHFAHVLLCRKH